MLSVCTNMVEIKIIFCNYKPILSECNCLFSTSCIHKNGAVMLIVYSFWEEEWKGEEASGEWSEIWHLLFAADCKKVLFIVYLHI